MSDSDDQDRTRIQPRGRKLSTRRSSRDGDGNSADGHYARENSSSRRQNAPSQRPPQDPRQQKRRKNSEDITVFEEDNFGSSSRRVHAAQNSRNQMRTAEQTQAMVGDASLSSRGGKSKSLQTHDILKGRFVLERVLGSGGMGVVYKAKDLLKVEAKDRDPYVAIKVLGEDFRTHPEAFIALQRESRKTQRIAHPNIVNVHDFDKDEHTVFMTMEFLEGTPLDKLLKKRRNRGLPSNDVWQILGGLCSALAYAHEQNIIHSDLKPGNIFVTNSGVSKVFDFGIARAVAKAEQSDVPEADRTVFDAGSLGALTPAYASLEMLLGDPPDVRDDIYALGCIAYELFTGEHPYKRKNAKEAKRLGIKPKRIESITKHQWRVIEHSLAIDREKRIGTVKEFWSGLTQKYSRPYMLWATMALVVLVAGGVVYDRSVRGGEQPMQTISEENFRVELETKIRQEFLEENLKTLITNNTFDDRWQAEIWQQMQDYTQLLGDDNSNVMGARGRVYQLYIEEIEANIEEENFDDVTALVENASRYTNDRGQLEQLAQSVVDTLQQEKDIAQQAKLKEAQEQQRKEQEQRKLAEQRKLEEQRRQTAQRKLDDQRKLEEQRKRDEQKRITANQQQKEVQKPQPRQVQNQQRQVEAAENQKQKEFDQAVTTIKDQLRCRKLLNMNELDDAVKTLRRVNPSVYEKEENDLVKGVAKCINNIGKNFPDKAKTYLAESKVLFNNHSALKTAAAAPTKKDTCTERLAGFGSRGRRSMCQDELSSGGRAPAVVVIPKNDDTPAFAIGRYEVSVDELNQFCSSTGACKPNKSVSGMFPATNIPYQTVSDYLKWLSSQTGKNYRLPTLEEWTFAASARNSNLDSNRNCFLDARGVQKGGGLISGSIGQQNNWGLVNYVGNASEWVTSGGGRLSVVGGSYKTDMDECNISWSKNSSGKADPEVGFRLVRELSQ